MNIVRIYMVIASTVMILSLIDMGFWGWAVANKKDIHIKETYRKIYNLRSIKNQDVILIGDSFVWGSGVAEEDRFGSVLEKLYLEEKHEIKVYSLGLRGAAIGKYIQSLKIIPDTIKTNRIILSYSMNDFPWTGTAYRRVKDVVGNVSNGALSFRLMGDILRKIVTPSVDEYIAEIIESYSKGGVSYPGRLFMLEKQLQEFKNLSNLRSYNPPIILIIPIMVDFHSYPLNEAHNDLRIMAKRLGYKVLDLLPVFQEQLGDGVKFRITKNDSHFTPYVHRLVARCIYAFLHKSASAKCRLKKFKKSAGR